MKRVILVFALLLNSSIAFSATYSTPESIGPIQTKTLPYSLIGQLNFANGRSRYLGSATVIRPSSVLTAAHNLWVIPTDSPPISFYAALSQDPLFSPPNTPVASMSSQAIAKAFADTKTPTLAPSPSIPVD